MSTQPSISPGSVKWGPASAGKAKAWFILFADKRVGVQIKLWSAELHQGQCCLLANYNVTLYGRVYMCPVLYWWRILWKVLHLDTDLIKTRIASNTNCVLPCPKTRAICLGASEECFRLRGAMTSVAPLFNTKQVIFRGRVFARNRLHWHWQSQLRDEVKRTPTARSF